MSTTTKCPVKNNHEEADTRIFWLITLIQGNVLLRSTDTDILVIGLINFAELQLDNCSIVIQYGSNDYCNLNKLVELLEESTDYSLLHTRGIAIPRIIGALPFITGCEDLPYLRGYTKLFCIKCYSKSREKICGETNAEVNQFLKGMS